MYKRLKAINMPKIAILVVLTLTLPLLLATEAPIMAQETASSTDAVKDGFGIKNSPSGGLLNDWLGEAKERVQTGMAGVQKGLEEAAGRAAGKAQEALQAELARQANLAIQGAKEKTEAYVGGVVAIVKSTVINIVAKIKIFFTNLFTKNAPTH